MRYIFLNDIEYLFHNRKKILMLIFLIPLLVCMIINNNSAIEMFYTAFGINLNFNNTSVIELMMFIFNVVIYLFLMFDLYIDDMQFKMDNIFLRMDLKKWLFNKNIVFLFLSFLLKLIQYLLILLLMYFNNKQIAINQFINIFILDYIYISFIEFVSISMYILYITRKKLNIFFGVILLCILIFIPKNILSMNKYILLILIGVLNFIMIMFISKIGKIIIEKVRR